MMDTSWYLRLFYVPILNFIVSWILSYIIRAKRMGFPELSKPMMIASMMSFVGGCVLLWFVPFRINVAFWIGICVIIFGQVVFGLGYSAMREYPEKKKLVVDWGIYKVSRHSHIIASMIVLLGTIIMGWNTKSTVYLIVWIYFLLHVIFNHFAILYEEEKDVEKFGQEYEEYVKRVPRYFLLK